MEILIQPNLDLVREDLGYDEYEEVNEEALLFQKGFDGYSTEIEDGETFEIPEDYSGGIIDDGLTYYIRREGFDGVWEKEELYGELEAGRYKLEGDTIIEM